MSPAVKATLFATALAGIGTSALHPSRFFIIAVTESDYSFWPLHLPFLNSALLIYANPRPTDVPSNFYHQMPAGQQYGPAISALEQRYRPNLGPNKRIWILDTDRGALGTPVSSNRQ